jgi:small subunit ribosomal protein S1
VGDVVEGKVVRLTNFGAFVELADGIEGLIHVSEFDSSQGGEKLELRAGENYQMKIIRLVPEERKIGLSIRALKDEEFRADWEAYAESTGRPEVTLGDHFKNIK